MALIAACGLSMQLAAETAQVRYAGVFLGSMGLYPCLANTLTWMSNNLEGVYKRGLSLGIMVMWNNLNGNVSSNIHRRRDAPAFRMGHGIVLGYIVVFLLGGSIFQTLALRYGNRKRRNGDRHSRIVGLDAHDLHMLDDKRPDFFYTTKKIEYDGDSKALCSVSTSGSRNLILLWA